MKPRVHFHSDCPFFAGCENMLVNFFTNEKFTGDFLVSFSYRYSKDYESGFRNRVGKDIESVPLNLLDTELVKNYARKLRFKPLEIIILLLSRVLLLRYWFVLWNTLVLYRVFNRDKIDLLHINNGGYPGAYSCMSAVFAARLRGIRKIVYVVNNIAFPYTNLFRLLDYPLDRLVVRLVSVFVTGSSFAGGELSKVLRLLPGEVINIPNGIAPRNVTENRKEVLQRLGVDDSRVVLSVIAVLEERKGHIYFLKALKRLKEKDDLENLPVVLVEGSGSEFQNLQQFIVEAGLDEHVKFIGNEGNIFNIINASDIIALPSISHEDFPNIILEAMSLGKTVIASRLSGTPEQIEHMKSGILVQPREIEGLAGAISQAAGNSELRRFLGNNARQRFYERFAADISVWNYVKLYNSLLKEEIT